MGLAEALRALKRRLFNRSPNARSEHLIRQMDAQSVEAISSRLTTYLRNRSFGVPVVGDPTMSSDFEFRPTIWEKYQQEILRTFDVTDRYSDYFTEMDQYISMVMSIYADDATPLTPKTPLQEFTERVWAEDDIDD